MNLRLPKNILPIALGCFALVIWGHNSYKFFKGIKAADEPDNLQSYEVKRSITPKIDALGQSEHWVYESKYRDPFENRLFVQRAISKPAPPKKPKNRAGKKVSAPTVQFPKLRLTGVIADPNGSLAVIEDSKQQVFFAHEGDSISGVKIVSVDSMTIACEYQKQKFTLVLK